MRTFLIAMGGIRVGTIRPLELGADGLLEVADKPALPSLGYWAIPCLPRPCITPKKKAKSVSVQVKGATLKATCAQPKVKFSCTFDVVGCQEEDERETYLMAQAAFNMLYADPKDLRIRALEKDVKGLRDQLSREKRQRK